MFAADGMRPDLMERYADKGLMPTLPRPDAERRSGRATACCRASRRTQGSAGRRSPPAPGPVSTARRTTHSTAQAPRSTRRRASPRPGSSRPTRCSQSAERAGEDGRRRRVGRGPRLVPAIQGPVVDFRTFIGGRGIVLNFDLPGQPALAQSFGVQYQRQTLADAPLAPAVGGWSNVPTSFSTPKQTTFTHATARSRVAGSGTSTSTTRRTTARQLRPRADRQQRRQRRTATRRSRTSAGTNGRTRS